MIPFQGLFGAGAFQWEAGYGLSGVFNMLSAILAWDVVRGSLVFILTLALVGQVISMMRGVR
ncbi:MAG: hypothetical protein HZC40_12050 [Chloroflexi bacterium]|nr:hypothetical protein [Chloroflexota bacterium]